MDNAIIFKIGIALCILLTFAFGCLVSSWVITSVKLQGTIIIDTEHYSKPAHLFKFSKPLSELLSNQYVMFKVETGDLREVFGTEKKVDIDER